MIVDLLGKGITRRDLIDATLVGTGAALLGAGCPAHAQDLGADWTGYGGVGDYARANGNTADVVLAAHRIRDQAYSGKLTGVVDTGEHYDLVVVGGGFGGMGAMHAFKKLRPNGTCLLLDNQPIFGGYAKANEFDVGGYRIAGAQASMNFILPVTDQARADSYWDELGLPRELRFAELEGGNAGVVFQTSTSGALYHGEQSATVGYFADGRWATDVWRDDLRRAPWPEPVRRGLLTLRDLKRRGKPDAAEAARPDGITFADYAHEFGVSPDALAYVTLGMCQTGPQISALAAMSLPGIDHYLPGSPQAELAERFTSFPGGNTVILRHFVKAIVPDAIRGPASPEGVAGAVDLAALDRPGAPFRMRMSATAVRVQHEGDPKAADAVSITYEKGGRLHRVRARAVVLAIGSWVGKHIVADLPAERRDALDRFLYAPMLVVNVALTNWRFLDRLGFSAARWSEGFGFYATIRRPMIFGDRPAPFHPDKPIVLTMYVPFPNPDLPLEAQGPAGRAQLYGTSYADYERQIVAQLQRLFAGGGFDARRDVAGIVLNRWGHAFVTPGPGFFHGKDSPLKPASAPFGRIAFGQSGLDDWLGAAHAGARAVRDIVSLI